MHWLESGDLSGSLPNAACPKSRVMLFKHVLNNKYKTKYSCRYGFTLICHLQSKSGKWTVLGIYSDKSVGAENKHLVLLHTESIQAVLGLFPGTTQSVILSTVRLFQLGCPILVGTPVWLGRNSLFEDKRASQGPQSVTGSRKPSTGHASHSLERSYRENYTALAHCIPQASNAKKVLPVLGRVIWVWSSTTVPVRIRFWRMKSTCSNVPRKLLEAAAHKQKNKRVSHHHTAHTTSNTTTAAVWTETWHQTLPRTVCRRNFEFLENWHKRYSEAFNSAVPKCQETNSFLEK